VGVAIKTSIHRVLATADLSSILSTMNSQPQLLGPWKEIEPPEESEEMQKNYACHPWFGQILYLKISVSGEGLSQN
jgi:hypothetical protein